MQFPSDVIFHTEGTSLKISSAQKPPFSIDSGTFEILKFKTGEKFSCKIAGTDKHRLCSFISTTPLKFQQRNNQFTLTIHETTVISIISGKFPSNVQVDELGRLINSIRNRTSKKINEIKMQFPSDVIFHTEGTSLKISSAQKPPFSIDSGTFEILKFKTGEKFSCKIAGIDIHRLCSFISTTPLKFQQRNNQFTLTIHETNVTYIISGKFPSNVQVDELGRLINSIRNRTSKKINEIKIQFPSDVIFHTESEIKMQFPSDVIFHTEGTSLKISSAQKPPFSIDAGTFEILKFKTGEKFSCKIAGTDKHRLCSFISTTPLKFQQRNNQFTLTIHETTVISIISGKFPSNVEVDELGRLINSIRNRTSPWNSKNKLLKTKENTPRTSSPSIPKSTGPSLLKATKQQTPFAKRMKDSPHNQSLSKTRSPLASIPPQHSKVTPRNTDSEVIITAVGGKKNGATPTPASFYSSTNIPKMMSPPNNYKSAFHHQKSTTTKTMFPAYSSRRLLGVRRFKYERKSEAENNTASEKVVGFANLGNTCYMNAILQCLLNIPNFYQELRNTSNIDIVPHGSLYNRLCGLAVIKHNHEGIDTQRMCLQLVKQSISEAAKRFSGYAQHDAHEFLCQCLDQLKEDLSNELLKRKDEIQLPPEDLNMIFTCPIKENFETTIVHSITCYGCKEEVIKEEEYHDFSLVIPDLDENINYGSLGIDNLLELYFNDESIEYTCEKCQGEQAVLSHRFEKLPRVLVLHLKRYDVYATKKSDQIRIPKVLNISKQISAETVSPKDFEFDKTLWNNQSQPQQGFKKRKPSNDAENTPNSKTPKFSFKSSNNKSDLKAGENLAIAARESRRDEEVRQQHSTEGSDFTKIKGPRKSLVFTEDANTSNGDVNGDINFDNLTSVSDDEEADLKKALELSMQEFESQEKPFNKQSFDTSSTSTANTSIPNSQPFINISSSDTDSSAIDYGKKQLYNLVGIVNHHGLNTASGHYTCDCYDFKSKQWRNYNDSSVKDINEDELFVERSHSAYIVFYMHNSCYEAIESKS